MFDFTQHQQDIDRLCRKYGIARFEIFGSALREDFSAESDIDCLIDFTADGGNYFELFFEFKYELESLFERPVDLIVRKALRNPYFIQEMEENKQLVYAA